jgi:hypothetical protein
MDDDVKISYIQLYQNEVSVKAKEKLYPFLKKALEEVLKACSYLEQENFARDVQNCVKASIEMLFNEMDFGIQMERQIYMRIVLYIMILW